MRKAFSTSQKQKLDQKQSGFVVGGPGAAAAVYDGRNKTFFLVNYEGLRRTLGTRISCACRLPSELAGRFTTTIIDPVTGQPFPNNTIPRSRYSRLANLALDKKYWPAPNADVPQGNYIRQRDLPTEPTSSPFESISSLARAPERCSAAIRRRTGRNLARHA